MSVFSNWCTSKVRKIRSHTYTVMTVTNESAGVSYVASRAPSHYSRIAETFYKLENPECAKMILSLMPTSHKTRVGDIGEILATEWVDGCDYGYRVPIKKLRWKDTPNMPMKGVDIVGIRESGSDSDGLEFLKGEVKKS